MVFPSSHLYKEKKEQEQDMEIALLFFDILRAQASFQVVSFRWDPQDSLVKLEFTLVGKHNFGDPFITLIGIFSFISVSWKGLCMWSQPVQIYELRYLSQEFPLIMQLRITHHLFVNG